MRPTAKSCGFNQFEYSEGAAKPSDIEFAHFLDTSLGSAFEVETQLLITKNIGYINEELYNVLTNDLNEIERQINGLIHSLRKSEGYRKC